jgi:poly(3-hydroxybutyrate) depolymerase
MASSQYRFIAALFAALVSFGRVARADDSCSRADDGVCDELDQCALDTDSSDCAAACEAGTTQPRLNGVCAHYAAVAAFTPPGVAPSVDSGSHGSGGVGGLYAAELTADTGPGLDPTSRHYTVYVPPSYDPRVPTPLLFSSGGFTAGMYQMVAATQLMRTADANGFIVAFMQPKYELFNSLTRYVYAWDIYTVDWANNPDVDYFQRVIARLKQLYNIDRTRIFASGHSRGAVLSAILAFKLPDLIAGFYSASGFTHVDNTALALDQDIASYTGRKVPGVLVHGTYDQDVKVASSDLTAQSMTGNGWVQGDDFLYYRLDLVGHEWQPQYNQQIWDFLSSHPLPLDQAAP